MAEHSMSQEPRRIDNEARRADIRTYYENEPSRGPLGALHVASPAPLGLGIIGIITAILGCFYTGFIIPYESVAMRPAVGAASVVLGIILVLAGMWEFRKNYMFTATLFTAYGGILALLGVMFVSSNIVPAAGGDVHLLMALIFLCWTIFLGVLCLGALRTNAALATTMVLLFLSFFFLMLGSFIFNNGTLIRVGGWLAIVTALVAWAASLASVFAIEVPNEAFHLPFGRRLAVVE